MFHLVPSESLGTAFALATATYYCGLLAGALLGSGRRRAGSPAPPEPDTRITADALARLDLTLWGDRWTPRPYKRPC